ncbi:MAG: hypothetical protein QW279_16420 [Candidatus Jordarchaeaceae archaeon]
MKRTERKRREKLEKIKIRKWQIGLIALAISTVIFGSLMAYVYAISEAVSEWSQFPSYYGIGKDYHAKKVDQPLDTVYRLEDLGIVLVPIENSTEYSVRISDPSKALKWMSDEHTFDKYAIDSNGQLWVIYEAAFVDFPDPQRYQRFIEGLEKNKNTITFFGTIIFGCLWIFSVSQLKRRRENEENG